MSTFEVKVYRLEIEEHPNADAIELAKVGDYRSIVRKGQFKTGDLGVYIPEAAIVPEWVIIKLGLEGRLAGKAKNRVKAVKLRGVLSQGLIFPLDYRENVIDQDTQDAADHYVLTQDAAGSGLIVKEGDDVTTALAITKWEPPIPIHMAGEVFNAFGYTLKYDIENLKRFPDVLQDGEEVCFTEKLHGTWCCMGTHPDVEHPIVTSKGLSEKGLAFKFNEANVNNLYLRAFYAMDSDGVSIVEDAQKVLNTKEPVYILGEIFGAGIQDLTYGGNTPQFRVFDIYVGAPGEGRYLDPEDMENVAAQLDVDIVPVLYKGAYDKEVVEEFTNGKETVSGKSSHMREGIVIKPLIGRKDSTLGRVFLKSVSETYLLRKNATEYA